MPLASAPRPILYFTNWSRRLEWKSLWPATEAHLLFCSWIYILPKAIWLSIQLPSTIPLQFPWVTHCKWLTKAVQESACGPLGTWIAWFAFPQVACLSDSPLPIHSIVYSIQALLPTLHCHWSLLILPLLLCCVVPCPLALKFHFHAVASHAYHSHFVFHTCDRYILCISSHYITYNTIADAAHSKKSGNASIYL